MKYQKAKTSEQTPTNKFSYKPKVDTFAWELRRYPQLTD